MSHFPTILAIESSCDDTACAILNNGKVLANIQASQAIHEEFGGVVPELASREHMKNIWPLVDRTLKSSGIDINEISAIAFTRGPGLIGSLIVGVNFAKALAIGLQIPIIEVNHMQAHIGAHYIDEPKPNFPFICLTVSGGHTQLVLIKDILEMEVIGQSLDDAAGEAFDKSAKLFGLPYPGGPQLDKLAKLGEPNFKFNKPRVKELDFSFSGLKTSILYFVQKQPERFVEENLNDLCASVQKTIVDILLDKIEKASKKYNIKELAIGGGVAANSELRERFTQLGQKKGWNTYIPQFQYCTDNAGMIGIIGHYKYLNKEFADHSQGAIARYSL